MPQLRRGARTYVEPDQHVTPIPVATRAPGGIDDVTPQDLEFTPGVAARPYRPDDAVTLRGTPVGVAGVKSIHRFDAETVFALDDEAKPVPPPNVTQAVRRSVFQPLQRNHYQFTINPAWGRHPGRFPRFSLINIIASTPQTPMATKAKGVQDYARMRPKNRFTKVLSYPRQNAEPDTYGGFGV